MRPHRIHIKRFQRNEIKDHQDLASQALASKLIQAKLIEILLSHSSLYEDLRARAQAV